MSRVMIVDDEESILNSLKRLLRLAPCCFGGKTYALEIETFTSAKAALARAHGEDFDLFISDYRMPEMDGIEATRRGLRINPDLNIIALSMYGEEEYYYKMVDAGAKGFLVKDSDISEVREAVMSIMKGGSYFSQELLYHVIQKIKHRELESKSANLSKREKEILFKICEGFSNQEIAESLFISKRTVDKHRANLLGKTNSKNTASLILFAIRNKLIEI